MPTAFHDDVYQCHICTWWHANCQCLLRERARSFVPGRSNARTARVGEHVVDRWHARVNAGTTTPATLPLERRKRTKRYGQPNRFPIHCRGSDLPRLPMAADASRRSYRKSTYHYIHSRYLCVRLAGYRSLVHACTYQLHPRGGFRRARVSSELNAYESCGGYRRRIARTEAIRRTRLAVRETS